MEDRFQCPYCNFTADDMYFWKKHMQKYVGFGSQDFPVYRCVKCKWTSTDQQRVRKCFFSLTFPLRKASRGPQLTGSDGLDLKFLSTITGPGTRIWKAHTRARTVGR